MQSNINWSDYFKYDPETGKIFWKVKPKHRPIQIGAEAGSPCKRGYICIFLNNTSYKAHRIAWDIMHAEDPLTAADEIDHINHVLDDNRAVNLRKVTRTQNNRNASRRKDNSSGITGVHWYRANEKWKAQIFVDGKYRHLGYFDNIFDAACARKSAEIFFGFHENHGSAPVK